MRGKQFFLFFYLPFLGIIAIFLIFSSINRAFIRHRVEDLVREQLHATSEILKSDIRHFLMEDYSVEDILDRYSSDADIHYMAILDGDHEILAWSSRFEGYLPLSLNSVRENGSWIIDSPVGKIYNVFTSFNTPEDTPYFLYLGYSLRSLEEMLAHSRSIFFVIFGLICVIGVVFFTGLFRLQSRYLVKTREADEQREEKQRYLEISAFTSGVAHEIKNPLNRLALLFEALQGKASSELREDVQLGKGEIHHISKIIDQFTAALKPLRIMGERFEVADLVDEARQSALGGAPRPAADVEYQGEPGLKVFADRRLLGQALINLLKNALEATSDGPVVVRAGRRRKGILLSVSDPGEGMPPEEAARVFDPFYTRKPRGMGIGLYITRKIVEAHGGRISVASVPGEGTTFDIQLPGE